MYVYFVLIPTQSRVEFDLLPAMLEKASVWVCILEPLDTRLNGGPDSLGLEPTGNKILDIVQTAGFSVLLYLLMWNVLNSPDGSSSLRSEII